jgi:hypothetical protein
MTDYTCTACNAPVFPVFHETQLSCGHPLAVADIYESEL